MSRFVADCKNTERVNAKKEETGEEGVIETHMAWSSGFQTVHLLE